MRKREAERAWEALAGRTILRVEPRAFRTMNAGDTTDWTCDPVLHLDDGTTVRLVVEETEVGDYGVSAVTSKP